MFYESREYVIEFNLDNWETEMCILYTSYISLFIQLFVACLVLIYFIRCISITYHLHI